MKRWNDYQVIILIVLTAFLAGGVAVFTKISLRDFPPFLFTFLRFSLALLALWPILLFKKEKITLKKFLRAWPVAIMGTLNVIFFAFGIRHTTASSAQMLYAATPLLAIIFSVFLLNERLNYLKIIGILTGFAGAILIILLPAISGGLQLGAFAGNLTVFAGVCAYALYTVVSKKYQKDNSPLALMTYFAIAATLASLIVLPFDTASKILEYRDLPLISILGIIYVSIFGTVIFYLSIQYIIKHATATIAATASYLQPVFTIFWAVALLQEKVTPGFIIGGILAFIGVLLVSRKPERKIL